jgi:hypothetical protein
VPSHPPIISFAHLITSPLLRPDLFTLPQSPIIPRQSHTRCHCPSRPQSPPPFHVDSAHSPFTLLATGTASAHPPQLPAFCLQHLPNLTAHSKTRLSPTPRGHYRARCASPSLPLCQCDISGFVDQHLPGVGEGARRMSRPSGFGLVRAGCRTGDVRWAGGR